MTRLTRLLAGAALAVLAATVGVLVTAAPASAASTWTQVSSGEGVSCAIRSDASLWCGGYNGSLAYQSANGKQLARVGADRYWASVSVGGSFACAITPSGQGYCWGSNYYGQLGVGDNTNRLTPTPIAFSGKLIAISAGNTHACAIDTWNDLYCWGDGREGALGLDSETDWNSPRYVGAGWSSVVAGDFNNCAIATDAKGYCWGSNYYGELGLGDGSGDAWVPSEISGGRQWLNIDIQGDHACGVSSTHRLYCWGNNDDGELGVGYPNSSWSPAQVGSNTTWGSVDVGGLRDYVSYDAFTCGLYRDGTRFCWGDNWSGQLGLTGTTDRHAPIRLLNEGAWAQISVGDQFACALRPDGTLACWGHNGWAELGLGDTVNRDRPTIVP
jgi:alpha-tubulin suppressor-like RCC1 family protein